MEEDPLVNEEVETDIATTTSGFTEHDLYPMLIEFLNNDMGLYCQRIDERRSVNSQGSGGNHWLHPDIVAMEPLDQSWDEAVRTCVRHGNDKSVRLWSALTGQYLAAFRGHVGDVYLLSWSIDSRMLVSCSKDSTIKVWDCQSRKLKEDLPGHADEVFSVDWSPDGSSVASGGRDRVVKIWRH